MLKEMPRKYDSSISGTMPFYMNPARNHVFLKLTNNSCSTATINHPACEGVATNNLCKRAELSSYHGDGSFSQGSSKILLSEYIILYQYFVS